jgi:hypothetical protein
MCHQQSSNKSIIGNKRVRRSQPDSNPELSGEPGAIQTPPDELPTLLFSEVTENEP